ncbi:NAD(P)-binding protein [Sorangium sp. So ce295]|uniref:NAD(P)-binding protein n=1 Tax=Sorangium sp. So ce295 TaxID=3133295 RepID=UPI003F5F4372
MNGNTKQDENEAVKQLRTCLLDGLRKRTEFLELCLRTGKLPTKSESETKLEDVLKSDRWRTTILWALKNFDAGGSFSTLEADDDTWLKFPNRAPEGYDSGSGAQADDLTRIAERAEGLVRRFVRQQIMYILLLQCEKADQSASNKERDALANIKIRAHEWYAAIPAELFAFYDAALLELLVNRRIAGDMGVLAYEASLKTARDFPNECSGVNTGKNEPVGGREDTEKEWKVPARREIEQLLNSAFYSSTDRPNPYWYLLQKPRSIVHAVDELLTKGRGNQREAETNLVAWSVSLFGAAGRRKVPNIDPEGRLPWFYEPDRVRNFLNAARYALTATGTDKEHEKDTRSTERDAWSADVLEQELSIFIDAYVEVPQNTSRPTCHQGTPCPGSTPSKTQQYFNNRLEAERIWWASFSHLDEAALLKGDEPKRLSQWCNRNLRDGWKICKIDTATTGWSKPTVFVYGAGIAGLTAAHELAERNFKVHVFESTPPDPRKVLPWTLDKMRTDLPLVETDLRVGGMARTQWARPHECHPNPAAKEDHRKLVPGEHGYRLFPSFYRHIFDTMKRTPVGEPRPGHRPTAFDQLEPTFRQVFAARKGFIPLSRERPRSLEAFRTEYMRLTQGLGFSRRDLARFFFKLVRYMMTCSARRAKEYEGMSLFTFFGADQKGFYSEPFIESIRAAPQALVAMAAERCDARTQGNVYLQLLLDQVLGGQYTDNILSGPTSDAWLVPWRKHLKENLGVDFHPGELLSIEQMDDKLEVLVLRPEVLVLPPKEELPRANYHVVALDPVAAERVTRWWDAKETSRVPHHGVPRELRGFTSHVTTELPAGLERYEIAVTYMSPLSPQEADDKLRSLLRRVQFAEDDASLAQRERSAFRSVAYSTGHVVEEPEGVPELRIHFWFDRKVGPHEAQILQRVLRRWAPPAEDVRLTSERAQRFPEAVRVRTPRLPEQRYGESPEDRLQTFTGIQYYFDQDFKLVRGHVYFPDTEWGLSAVSQSQFWVGKHFEDFDPKIRGVLSVDIGNCRRRSSFTGKSLLESSPVEIEREVWRQIKDSLRTTRGLAAPVTNLPLPEPRYCHLDSNLAFADRALRANRTPFLINNVGDWENRPRCAPWVPGRSKLGDGARTDGTGLWQAPHGGYRVHEDSVVFCGSYMRTFTRMNTMEAANESARHAVNAILDHMASTRRSDDLARAGITGDYCDIWDIEEHELEDLAFFKRVDEMLFQAGKPHIADILQFDKLADVAHPDPSPGQSLLAALGATLQKDWGADANDLAGSLNGLMEIVRAGKDLAGSLSGTQPNLEKLLSSLGVGKIGLGKQGP